jgi:A/G-specific adenine glycosylase
VRSRYFNYVVVSDADDRTIVKKTDKGYLAQLIYEFPLIETDKEDFDFITAKVTI